MELPPEPLSAPGRDSGPAPSEEGGIPFAPPHVPGYRLGAPLGRGGMGVVFRATQLEPDREVALKVLRGELSSPRARERFRREVEVLARIRHRSIVRILDAGVTEEGHPYYAMELVEGESWNQALESLDTERRPLRERLALFLQVCEGVSYLHREKVLHRDLKPGNLRVDRAGRARILDFGLVRTVGGSAAEVTRAGEPLGTSQYMSPEQWRDSTTVDGRTDVYSLGVILFELLGGTLSDELLSSRDLWRPDLSLRNRARDELTVGADLQAIVERALEMDPEARISDPSALALDIRRFLTDRPVLARRTPPVRRARLFVRRHAAPLRRLGICLALLLTGTIIAASEWDRAERFRRAAEARSENTLEVCAFVLDELGTGTWEGKIPVDEMILTVDAVLEVLGELPGDSLPRGPVAPLIERARKLREELETR
jgi:serine/threonine protein kinase